MPCTFPHVHVSLWPTATIWPRVGAYDQTNGFAGLKRHFFAAAAWHFVRLGLELGVTILAFALVAEPTICWPWLSDPSAGLPTEYQRP